jgi:hypothetical protein
MEYIAVTAFLAAALSGFMWLLTRNDHSSVFWAQEVRRIAAPGSAIAPNKSGSVPRSVMQYFVKRKCRAQPFKASESKASPIFPSPRSYGEKVAEGRMRGISRQLNHPSSGLASLAPTPSPR